MGAGCGVRRFTAPCLVLLLSAVACGGATTASSTSQATTSSTAGATTTVATIPATTTIAATTTTITTTAATTPTTTTTAAPTTVITTTTTTTVAPTTTATTTTMATTTTTADPAADRITAAQTVAGRYRGEWNNTTFGSSGAIVVEFSVDAATATATPTIDLGGFVFGGDDPPAASFVIDLRDEPPYAVDSPLLGGVTASLDADGTFTITTEDAPSDRIGAVTIEGLFDAAGGGTPSASMGNAPASSSTTHQP